MIHQFQFRWFTRLRNYARTFCREEIRSACVIIARVRCIKPFSFNRPAFFLTHFQRTLVSTLLHRAQGWRSYIESARSSSRLLHYFRHNRIRPRFIGSPLNRYIGRARKDNLPNEFLRWKFVRPQILSLIRHVWELGTLSPRKTYNTLEGDWKGE